MLCGEMPSGLIHAVHVNSMQIVNSETQNMFMLCGKGEGKKTSAPQKTSDVDKRVNAYQTEKNLHYLG